MPRKRSGLIFLAVIALSGMLAVFLWRPEPVYHGKKLSEWLNDLAIDDVTAFTKAQSFKTDSPEALTAAQAVRAIGTNAIPTMLSWLGDHDSSWILWLDAQLKKRTKIRFSLARAREKGITGLRGLAVLGTNALPFIFKIDRKVNKSDPYVKRKYFAFLGEVFREAAGLKNTDPANFYVGPIQTTLTWSVHEIIDGESPYLIVVADEPTVSVPGMGSFLTLLLLKTNGALLDIARMSRTAEAGYFRWKVVDTSLPNRARVIVRRTVGIWDWGTILVHRGTNYTYRQIGWVRPPPEESPNKSPARPTGNGLHPPIGFAIRDDRFEIIPGNNQL